MTPLLALCAALLGQAFAADPPSTEGCLKAYRDPDYKNVWSLSREDWQIGCKDKKPEGILAQAKNKFVKDCVEEASEPVKTGLITVEKLRAYCEDGNPGKSKIPRPQAAAKGLSPAQRAEAAKAAAESSASVGRIAGKIQGGLAGDVASLYGEKSAATGGVPGGVSGKAAAAQAPSPIPPPLGLKINAPPASSAVGVKALEQRIIAAGVSKESAETVKKLLHGMLDGADPRIVQNLVDANVHIVIVPKDKKMTDLPYFASLKGKKTFDGRLWDDVRGVGGVPMDGGGVAIAAPEEGLSGKPNPKGYPKGFVFIHEFGHVVQNYGLAKTPEKPVKAPSFWDKISAAAGAVPKGIDGIAGAEDGAGFLRACQLMAKDARARYRGDSRATVEKSDKLYEAAMKRKDKSGLGGYADSNSHEYFAQSTAAYFGNGYPKEDQVDLWKTDPNTAYLMYQVYGPAKRLKP